MLSVLFVAPTARLVEVFSSQHARASGEHAVASLTLPDSMVEETAASHAMSEPVYNESKAIDFAYLAQLAYCVRLQPTAAFATAVATLT